VGVVPRGGEVCGAISLEGMSNGSCPSSSTDGAIFLMAGLAYDKVEPSPVRNMVRPMLGPADDHRTEHAGLDAGSLRCMLRQGADMNSVFWWIGVIVVVAVVLVLIF
jgi:hypothetical protein